MKHVVTILGISMVGLLTACHPSGGGTGQKASASFRVPFWIKHQRGSELCVAG